MPTIDRPCAVCGRAPCACPDPSDESDEQAAQEEQARIRELLECPFRLLRGGKWKRARK